MENMKAMKTIFGWGTVLLFGCLTLGACSVSDDGFEPETDPPMGNNKVNRVFEYLPAPGQFINTGGCTAATPVEAAAWAQQVLAEGQTYVSLGGFGGYIVVGFESPIENRKDAYDFAVAGNSFDGSSEPGIVWVMRDENGNGRPDDVWYELKGSEHGKPETVRNYEVTYYRPANLTENIRWTDNRDGQGTIDRNSFHGLNDYFPAWVPEDRDSYTLKGTLLESRVRVENGIFVWGSYDWGYADNRGSDRPGPADQDGNPAENRFDIADAVDASGAPVSLTSIDFVKVQTGVNAKGGPEVGELSTEVFGFRVLN